MAGLIYGETPNVDDTASRRRKRANSIDDIERILLYCTIAHICTETLRERKKRASRGPPPSAARTYKVRSRVPTNRDLVEYGLELSRSWRCCHFSF